MSETEARSTLETGEKEKVTLRSLEEEVQRERTLGELLKSASVKSVLPHFRSGIIYLPRSTTIAEAFTILSANQILSAPIVDVEKTKVLGLVDMFDLLSYVIQKYVDGGALPPSLDSARWEEIFNGINTLSAKGIAFGHERVEQIINKSSKNPFCTVVEDATLPQLLFIFKDGLHRVIAVDRSETPRAVVSQSNVLKFVARNVNLFGSLAKKTVKELNFATKSGIVQITTEASAIYGFYILNELKISAVAVVDKGGILLGNLSVSDMRGLDSNKLSMLFLPVLQYLKEQCPFTKFPPITCTENDTFEYVVLKLAGTKTHRIWIIDELGKPTGVISLSDIMQILYDQVAA